GRLGRTLIRHTDFGVAELGTVHAYGRVQAALDAAVAAAGVTVSHGGPAAVLRQDSEAVELAQDSATWHSRVAVQAEGGSEPDQRPGMRRDYRQHAVLAVVRAERPKPDQALERFTRTGPLALLPFNPPTPGGAEGRTYAVIWCCSPTQAQQLQ